MVLIIGGAYQGKLAYARERFPGASVGQCDENCPDPDLSAGIVNGLHLLALAQLRAGIDTVEYLR